MAKKKICDGCKKPVKKRKSRVRSCRHENHNAHKAQKIIGVTASFIDLATGKPAKVCKKCQILLLGGMVNGGNF